MDHICPLCEGTQISLYHKDKKRSYLCCQTCSLVFVPPRDYPSSVEERRIYDLHQNSADDPGYRRFLSRLADPLMERIGEGREGLDFGCGPGPALSVMLEEKGSKMSLYDIFYFDNRDVLEREYDFICCTEVVEHLQMPAEVLDRLFSLLKREGWLAIMTKMVIDQKAFSSWHYIQDPTHICFFSRKTFEFLSRKWGCSLQFIDKDVIFFKKIGINGKGYENRRI